MAEELLFTEIEFKSLKGTSTLKVLTISSGLDNIVVQCTTPENREVTITLKK